MRDYTHITFGMYPEHGKSCSGMLKHDTYFNLCGIDVAPWTPGHVLRHLFKGLKKFKGPKPEQEPPGAPNLKGRAP